MKKVIGAALAAICFSISSASAATVTLDFEDQQLPSASGWQQVPGQPAPGSVSTVVAGTVPGKSGSYVLNITGRDRFGWFLDLTGQIAPNSSWSFSADIQRVASINLGGGGINDIAITKFGGGTQQSLDIGAITDQNWHAFEMMYDAVSGTFTGSIDGNAMSTSSIVSSFATEGITFLFGNINVEKSVNFDNIRFDFNPATPSEIPLPASAFLLLGGIGALAAGRRR